ncbi:MAG TPA: response regulator transcription factor [Chloroflexia bacterium]|nr:response regulator transcription factor [Chloroflexia bacterium]
MTRVYIVARTPMIRAGLRQMLTSGDTEVAGEAASLTDIEGALDGVDVLVVGDTEMLEYAARSVVGDGALGIVVLSGDDRPAEALDALPLRGWGIIPLEAPASELLAAVEAVGQGMVVLSLPVARRLLAHPSTVQALGTEPLDEPLTARESEVLSLLSQGLPNKLIARDLGISEHTVKFHISSIYTKLGASSRTDAVNRGARHGLISF